MMYNEHIKHIVELFLKNVNHTISEIEKKELSDWIDENPKHKALYDRWLDDVYIIGKAHEMQRVNYSLPKQKMERRIKAGKVRFRKLILLRVAVAACILAVVTFSFLEFGTDSTSLSENPVSVVSGKQVQLTLSNGEQISLDGEVRIQDSNTEIHSGDKELTYSSKEQDAENGGEVYNELFVPRGSEYMVVLSDGTRVFINSETTLRYPVEFKGKERRVVLEGEGYFVVTKNEELPFVVETGEQELTVLGTEFNIQAYRSDDKIVTTLVRGKVKVAGADTSLVLLPSQQSIYANAGLTKRQVVVSSYVAWKDGYFWFDGMKLHDILNTLERWYDVDFEYSDPTLGDIVFRGGATRYASIEKMLEVFESTNELKFEYQGSKIIVR